MVAGRPIFGIIYSGAKPCKGSRSQIGQFYRFVITELSWILFDRFRSGDSIPFQSRYIAWKRRTTISHFDLRPLYAGGLCDAVIIIPPRASNSSSSGQAGELHEALLRIVANPEDASTPAASRAKYSYGSGYRTQQRQAFYQGRQALR